MEVKWSASRPGRGAGNRTPVVQSVNDCATAANELFPGRNKTRAFSTEPRAEVEDDHAQAVRLSKPAVAWQ